MFITVFYVIIVIYILRNNVFLKKFIFTLANAVKDLVNRNLYQSLNYIGHFLVKDVGPPPLNLEIDQNS